MIENNSKIITLNGVYDRLRVMLISGEPNMALRSWRNLLNADPAIELIHFTILRPPNKRDLTPVRELSLIPFPTRELFAANIEEFDLIIFDQYSLRGILPPQYLNNIVEYVYNGGAVLDATGPSYASQYSLSNSPLKTILPTIPTGNIINTSFIPKLTKKGERHPVTSNLKNEYEKEWGKWYRYIETIQINGETLLETKESKPILILNKIGSGRVAQILSDHSWIWLKSNKDQGPHAGLFRKIIHWLLREPELEEDAIQTKISLNKIEIFKNSLAEGDNEAKIILPDNKIELIKMKDNKNGRLTGSFTANLPGKYDISIDDIKKSIIVGHLDELETSDVRSTKSLLEPITNLTGGGMFWINDGLPKVISVKKEQPKSGKNWIGVVSNKNTIAENINKYSFLNWYLTLLILLSLLFLTWYKESK